MSKDKIVRAENIKPKRVLIPAGVVFEVTKMDGKELEKPRKAKLNQVAQGVMIFQFSDGRVGVLIPSIPGHKNLGIRVDPKKIKIEN
jgi:hypothetical protein